MPTSSSQATAQASPSPGRGPGVGGTANPTSFRFPSTLRTDDSYSVSIDSYPSNPTQLCSVAGGFGTVDNNNINRVVVNCSDAWLVQVEVTGLEGSGLRLERNGEPLQLLPGDNNLAIPFFTPVAPEGVYRVAIAAQPIHPWQQCEITGINENGGTGGSHTIAGDSLSVDGQMPIDADITVAVSCTTRNFDLLGDVQDLLSNDLHLRYTPDDGSPVVDRYPLPGGAESWVVPAQASGSGYMLEIIVQPDGQECRFAGGVTQLSGTIGGNNLRHDLYCGNLPYTVSGTLSGLVGDRLDLTTSGAVSQTLQLTTNDPYTFNTPVPFSESVTVAISRQPQSPWQMCEFDGGGGTTHTIASMPASDETLPVINCTTSSYTLSAQISGYSAVTSAGLELDLNGTKTPVTAAGVTLGPLASGTSYTVTISEQAGGQLCTITNPNGTVQGSNITIFVSCNDTSQIWGNITGLEGSGLQLKLVAAGHGDETVDPAAAISNYQFPPELTGGTTYTVSIEAQPTNPWQDCTLHGSGTTVSGTVDEGDPSTRQVNVSCTTLQIPLRLQVNGANSGSGMIVRSTDDNVDHTIPTGAGPHDLGTVASGVSRSYQITTQPTSPWATCEFSGGGTSTGPISYTNQTEELLIIDCTLNKYEVKVALNGLATGDSITLNGGGHSLTLTTDTAAEGVSFSTSYMVDSGQSYTVAVSGAESLSVCTLNGASGTIAGADVVVGVACSEIPRVAAATDISYIEEPQNVSANTTIGTNGRTIGGVKYVKGGSFVIQLKFSTGVSITGTPRLRLNLAGTIYANYLAARSDLPNGLVGFEYNVAGGHASPDLTSYFNIAGTNALELNGGTIVSADDPNVNASLVLPGTNTGLITTPYIVDTIALTTGVLTITHGTRLYLNRTMTAGSDNLAVYEHHWCIVAGQLSTCVPGEAINPGATPILLDSGTIYRARLRTRDRAGNEVFSVYSVARTGLEFRLSPGTSNGNLGSVTGADAMCPAGYRAMIGATNRTAAADDTGWPLYNGWSYYRASGGLVGAVTSQRRFVFDLNLPPLPNGEVELPWTGLNANWTISAATCTSWTATLLVNGQVGNTASQTTNAISAASYACTFSHPVYCVEIPK